MTSVITLYIILSFLLFQPFFVERVFHIFDKDDNGSISLQEFIDAMHQFAGQSPDDKIKFLFKVYDIDGESHIFCLHGRYLLFVRRVSDRYINDFFWKFFKILLVLIIFFTKRLLIMMLYSNFDFT